MRRYQRRALRRGQGWSIPQTRVSMGSENTDPAKARDSGPVRSILLTADLTPNGPSSDPAGLVPDGRVRVAVFASRDGAADERPLPVVVATKPIKGSQRATVHPHVATDAVVSAIRSTLCHQPDAVIYLVLRAPKTVALAVGHGLSGAGEQPGGQQCAPCVSRSCRYPWKRIVPLLPDQDAPRRDQPPYVAMRVTATQPSASAIASQARAHGLDLSGVREGAAS